MHIYTTSYRLYSCVQCVVCIRAVFFYASASSFSTHFLRVCAACILVSTCSVCVSMYTYGFCNGNRCASFSFSGLLLLLSSSATRSCPTFS